MVYNKTKWQDEIPDLTKPILDSSGKQKVDPQTGRPLFELVQTGTRITSAKLNNIEDGISAAHTLTEQLAAEVNGNFVASGLVFTFTELTASWTAGIAYVSGRRFDIAAGSLTLTAKQGQYIYMNVSGVIQKTTTEATARAALLLWYFATDASKVITSTDMRRIITPDSYAIKSETVAKEDGKGLSKNDYTDADKARVQSHEDKLADLVPRLNTSTTMQLVLQPGLQTIQAARDMPFNLSSISGRMLLNLLGRAGTFDTTSGWSLTGGSGVIDQTYPLYGANALRFTLSGTSGRVNRSVTTVSGKRYLAAVEVRMGTATNAYVYVTGMSNGAPVNNAASHTLTYVPFTANSTTTEIGVMINGANGQTAYIDGFRLYELPSTDYSLISNMTAVEVAARWPYSEGLAGVRNPYAIRWTSTAKTDVAAILALDTELLASPVPADDAERDRLELGVDGQYYKTSVWNKIMLDGSLPWVHAQSWTGYKAVAWLDVPSPLSNSGFITKYDKSVLSRWIAGSSAVSADSHVLDGTTSDLWITISSADSGWGDKYSPTSDEIKAYFFGWRMYDTSTSSDGSSIYNRTDNANKAWARRTNGVDASGGYIDGMLTLPTFPAAGWSSYELMYKRSVTIVEPAASEGTLNLVQGDNVIEVGSGLVLRETTKPLLYPGSVDRYMTNYLQGGGNTNPLRFSPAAILEVYADNRKASINWGTTTDKVTWRNGVYVDRIDGFNNEKTYSVSYFRSEKFPVVSIAGSTANNERAIIDDALRDIQQIARRVSVVESKKADKDNLNWTTPTVVGGWNPLLNFGYRIEGNRIYFRGIISNGATAAGTLILTLPDRVRTQRSFTAALGTYGGTSGQTVAVDFLNNGQVKIVVASALAQISFEGFSYSLD